ncbi:restriction endonuclease subunit S [Staphylococcus saprophyticus]|uniref:restriction endonuclease subunit S n=1 Tax=Staphylococcus saprophyticus TaxID=29385 RepID=UPI0034DD3E63
MEFKLKTLAQINQKSLKKATFPEYIVYLDTKNLTNGKFEELVYFNKSKDKIPSRARRIVQKNDILISTVRPNQKHYGFITKDKENYIVSTGFAVITPDETKVNPYFLYKYLTLDSITNYLQNIAENSTSAYPAIKPSVLSELSIILPDKTIQDYISKLLRSIDDKIDLNEQIIANLEELSQTLFKRWFVDFEFPDENGNPYKSNGGEMVDSELGAIPKGWNVKNLDDIANYMNGLAMQKFKPTDNQNSLPVVKIKELKNGSTDENSNRCTSEIPEKALIVDGDIIFSWSATLLVKMWCGGKAGLNQHLFKVSSDKYPKWFYYYWTKRYIDYFIGIANDKATTMGHINRKHLSHAKILTPNDQTLEKFSRTFDDLLEKELSVSKESKRLTELRDTLLPKLMSGEIEIPTDIEVNEDELSI